MSGKLQYVGEAAGIMQSYGGGFQNFGKDGNGGVSLYTAAGKDAQKSSTGTEK